MANKRGAMLDMGRSHSEVKLSGLDRPAALARVPDAAIATPAIATTAIATAAIPTLLPKPLLVDRGDGLMYDTVRDITWLQDTNYAQTSGASASGASADGQMTWDAAMAWVKRLNYRGITGWRLPTARNRDGSGPCTGDNCPGSELGHFAFELVGHASPGLQLVNFTPFSIYWSSTAASASEAYAFKMSGLKQGTLPKDPWAPVAGLGPVPLADVVRAWPVHDGDVARRYYRWIVGPLVRIKPWFRSSQS